MSPLAISDVVDKCRQSCPESVNLYPDFAPVYAFTMEQRGLPQSYHELVTSAVSPETDSVAEFACGDGSLLARLEQTYELTVGIDISTALLSIARSKSDAVVIRADVRMGCLRESFGAVVMVGRSLAHMITDNDVSECFTAAHETLTPEGRFIFDCHDKSILSDEHTREREFEDDQYHVKQQTETKLMNQQKGLAERIDRFVITSKETNDSVTVETDPWTLRMFDTNFLKDMLETTGFVVGNISSEYNGHQVGAEK